MQMIYFRVGSRLGREALRGLRQLRNDEQTNSRGSVFPSHNIPAQKKLKVLGKEAST